MITLILVLIDQHKMIGTPNESRADTYPKAIITENNFVIPGTGTGYALDLVFDSNPTFSCMKSRHRRFEGSLMV